MIRASLALMLLGGQVEAPGPIETYAPAVVRHHVATCIGATSVMTTTLVRGASERVTALTVRGRSLPLPIVLEVANRLSDIQRIAQVDVLCGSIPGPTDYITSFEITGLNRCGVVIGRAVHIVDGALRPAPIPTDPELIERVRRQEVCPPLQEPQDDMSRPQRLIGCHALGA